MRRLFEDRGASLVEYALLIALIALVCVGALQILGSGTSFSLSKASTSMFGS